MKSKEQETIRPGFLQLETERVRWIDLTELVITKYIKKKLIMTIE